MAWEGLAVVQGIEFVGSRDGNFVIDTNNGETFELNHTAMMVLQAVAEGRSMGKLLHDMRDRFPEVSFEDLVRDMQEMVGEAKRMGLLVIH